MRILSALPIFGKQEKIRDQRVVTLTPLNENISKEHEYIETGLERLQSTLTGANNVRFAFPETRLLLLLTFDEFCSLGVNNE